MSSLSGDQSSPHFAVILAGGSGTRLWPLSRPSRPKHLLPLLGAESLLQGTARRVLTAVEPDRVVTVTQASQKNETAAQLGSVDPRLAANVLAEPRGRNTLPAVAWAVLTIAARSPDALVSVFPSDHFIGDPPAFQAAWKTALEAARRGFLMTFGIRPSSPETGYGYIRAGEPLPVPGAFRTEAFVEKPGLETAKEYVASGLYSWNSGMFVFKASVFLEELKTLQPAVWEALAPERATEGAYDRLPSLSIDVGVMEKSSRVGVVPADMAWSDLGSWQAIYAAQAPDGNGNVVQGDVVALGTEGSLLISTKGVLGAVGLKDMAVIKTENAVLVGPRDRMQDVKKIAESCAEPAQVHRPWGNYTVLEERPGYKIKRIVVDPGQKLSLQRHRKRAEHWVVIEGAAQVICGEKTLRMGPNESTFIPQGEKHRLENPGAVPLVIIEVQTGSYVGEDDIERFDDVYGRASSK